MGMWRLQGWKLYVSCSLKKAICIMIIDQSYMLHEHLWKATSWSLLAVLELLQDKRALLGKGA